MRLLEKSGASVPVVVVVDPYVSSPPSSNDSGEVLGWDDPFGSERLGELP